MKPRRLLRPFASADECFDEVRALIVDLERAGRTAAAAELREGLGCLNGLTDGWALFLEAVEAVAVRYGPSLSAEQQRRLGAVRRVADRVTHRH
jgi:hypothetical protein